MSYALRSLLALSLLLVFYCSAGAMPEWVTREGIRGGYRTTMGEKVVADMGAAGLNSFICKLDISQWDPTTKEAEEKWIAAADTCAEHNVKLFATGNFLGGSAERALGFRPDGPKYVSSTMAMNGTPCPLDEYFWERVVGDRARLVARLSLDHPALVGFLVDCEMYGADSTGYSGPCLSDHCLALFAEDHKWFQSRLAQCPAPGPARGQWFYRRVRKEIYTQWYKQRISRICRRIERSVHNINPNFLLGTLPLREDAFSYGMVNGFGTKDMPFLLLSEATYWGGWHPTVTKFAQELQAQYPVRFVGGLGTRWIAPMQMGPHAYWMGTQTGGYWVYTMSALEGNGNKFLVSGTPADYWHALAQANVEISKKRADPNYVSSLKITLPEIKLQDADRELLCTANNTLKAVFAAPGNPSQRNSTLRGRYMVLVAVGEDGKLEVTLHNVQFGRYTGALSWRVLSPQGQTVCSGVAVAGKSSKIALAGLAPGIYGIIGDPHFNGWSVNAPNHA